MHLSCKCGGCAHEGGGRGWGAGDGGRGGGRGWGLQ